MADKIIKSDGTLKLSGTIEFTDSAPTLPAGSEFLTTGAQTIAGAKTFSSGILVNASNLTGVSTNADDLLIGDQAAATERGITLGSTTASSIRWNDGADAGVLEYNHSSNYMRMIVNGATEAMRIDSAGNVGIGTTSPDSATRLHVRDAATSGARVRIQSTDTSGQEWDLISTGSANTGGAGNLLFVNIGGAGIATSMTSSGNVGIGTTSPGIGADSNYTYLTISETTSASPIAALELQGSRNNTIQTNAVIDAYEDSTQIARIQFLTGTRPGSGGSIDFRVPNSGGTFQTALAINESSNVGIGTSSPSYKLTVKATDNTSTGGIALIAPGAGTAAHIWYLSTDVKSMFSIGSTSGNWEWSNSQGTRMTLSSAGLLAVGSTKLHPTSGLLTDGVTGSNSNHFGFIFTGSNAIARIDNTLNITIGTSSDYRLKDNVTLVSESILPRLSALEVKRYDMKNLKGELTGESRVGLIAHEVGPHFPELEVGTKDAVDEEGNPDYQSVDYQGFVPYLIKAIQELKAELDALKNA